MILGRWSRLNSIPPSTVHLETQIGTLFGNRVFIHVVKVRVETGTCWYSMDPNSRESVLLTYGKGHRETQRRRRCEDGGRDQSDVSITRECSGLSARREAWDISPSEPPKEAVPPTACCLTFGLLHCVRIHFSCFKPPKFMVICYSSPRKLTH